MQIATDWTTNLQLRVISYSFCLCVYYILFSWLLAFAVLLFAAFIIVIVAHFYGWCTTAAWFYETMWRKSKQNALHFTLDMHRSVNKIYTLHNTSSRVVIVSMLEKDGDNVGKIKRAIHITRHAKSNKYSENFDTHIKSTSRMRKGTGEERMRLVNEIWWEHNVIYKAILLMRENMYSV